MAEQQKTPRRRRQAPPDVPMPDLPETLSDAERVAGFRLGARSALVVISDGAISVERTRIRAQVRLAHLKRRGAHCPYTAWLHREAGMLEQKVDDLLAKLVRNHPAHPWFSRVKGTGGEAIGKVLGHIEAFGRFYPIGDPQIPPYVKRPSEMVPVLNEETDELVEVLMVWVEGIERLATPSKLHKYAGFAPGQRREAGKLSGHNTELRTMCYRLATSLLKAQGRYAGFYDDYKLRKTQEFTGRGIRILPTPRGRMCVPCNAIISLKTARFCPTCGGQLSLKAEPENTIWQGHLHMMAMRRMVKLFLDHLWVVWREALNLPGRDPYPVAYLGHSQIIRPGDMADRPAPQMR